MKPPQYSAHPTRHLTVPLVKPATRVVPRVFTFIHPKDYGWHVTPSKWAINREGNLRVYSKSNVRAELARRPFNRKRNFEVKSRKKHLFGQIESVRRDSHGLLGSNRHDVHALMAAAALTRSRDPMSTARYKRMRQQIIRQHEWRFW